MRIFSGRGGEIHALGEPHNFHCYLEDCGDGWDWRAPKGLRCWLQEGLSFEVFDGEWRLAEPVELHRRSGRVGFNRCLRGMVVRAGGTCLPSSLIATGGQWRLEIEVHVKERTTLGSVAPEFASVVGDAFVRIEDLPVAPIDSVMVLLPHGGGAFIGTGEMKPDGDATVVRFDEKGVRYEPR